MDKRNGAKKILEKIRVKVPPGASMSSSSNPRRQCNRVSSGCSTQLVIQNHLNFKRSAAPSRCMFYQDGSWVDLPGEVVERLRFGFLEGKPAVDVPIEGSMHLFDFLRMLQIDLETGSERSIAWIDVNGKCFFPKVFVGGERNAVPEDLKLEITISVDGNLGKRKRELLESEEEKEEGTGESSSNNQEHVSKKQQIVARDSGTHKWANVTLLREGEKVHSTVKQLFLSGISRIEPEATITAIHQWTRMDPLGRARTENFQKHMNIIKAARGTCNTTLAWHGTSAEAVASILTHGFGLPSKSCGSGIYGVGVYLSPVGLPYVSALLSDADDNGEKHVVLCRVVLGNVEKVDVGSKQTYPSNVNFDTGVDDVNNPKWYVVWSANMNSYILPLCVVSYKSFNQMAGRFRGLRSMDWVPIAWNMLTIKFFSKLKNSLPLQEVTELETLCRIYEGGELPKDHFVKQLRSIVGDEVLSSTIREIRASK
ncbi:probable inactive poly [ADP-ribose] polymerase SRO3 isoform X2 [Malania oleifera]|uniref:probable inactive poly [ADP-ribose] polymerase SRO3 isoform X2 n=1 Tax=Malania oleifera TaxID=397392 RepID=UPI0025AEA46D|nr:probable inactive poly [ADP-ribose] polymerase SRO3 isoform X2 [Malania oleifera]